MSLNRLGGMESCTGEKQWPVERKAGKRLRVSSPLHWHPHRDRAIDCVQTWAGHRMGLGTELSDHRSRAPREFARKGRWGSIRTSPAVVAGFLFLFCPTANRSHGLLRLRRSRTVGGTNVSQSRSDVGKSRVADFWTRPRFHGSANRDVLLTTCVAVVRPIGEVGHTRKKV